MKLVRAHPLLLHLARVAGRAALATLLLWLSVSVPLPLLTNQLFLMVRVPAAVFLFIVYIGKLLYDTFFYERYGT